MKAVERATAADLRRLPEDVRGSALAKAALNLARRLDGDPADREATMIARELRLTMGELHRLGPEGVTDDVECFLERLSAPDLGHTAH